MTETKHGRGLYLHVPFCKSKCAYCDFPSFAGCEKEMPRVIDRMCAELFDCRNAFPDTLVETMYIGGGTPSLLPPKLMERLLQAAREAFPFAPGAEISCEMNPGTVTPEFLSVCVENGVNRVSLGAQSNLDHLLSSIGRIHTFRQVREAADLLRSFGLTNFNLDMMLGLPGQTLKDVQRTLDDFLALSPAHLSCYALIVEEGTMMEKKVDSGEWTLPDEDTERDMYELARETLEKNGYRQYEISNFAKDGFVCRHNRDCWLRHEYLGVGAAACGFIGNVRTRNPSTIPAYLRGDPQEQTVLTEEDARFESVMLGLRLTEGLPESVFRKAHGMGFREAFGEKLDVPLNDGRLLFENGVLRLTRYGMDVMNSVLVELMPEN